MVNPEIVGQALEHAAREFPRESCGLLVDVNDGIRYRPCRNLAPPGAAKDAFHIDPKDYIRAEEEGEVVAIVHSHPYVSPEPSLPDLVAIEQTRVPWLIVNPKLGTHTWTEPSGFHAPYEGRPFVHGLTDCYSLVKDYYERELGVLLPPVTREDDWWHKGGDLYRSLYASAGFERVTGADLERYDLLVMMLGNTPVPNHGAVYLGEGRILHHVQGRLSAIDVYGGYWKKIHVETYRHKAVMR
jgi:proteasome lid subunit RPN8/RPN11